MSPDDNRERAVLVWAGRRRCEASQHLDELESLAISAELDVAARLVQELRRASAATFIGSGKVEELAALATEVSANVVVFDEPLSPAQRRNIERRVDIKVIDRSQLILDIFARRAWTRAGKIQVELAQLEYLLPRLTRHWTHLSRIQGGIGTKGPGETQLEVDRRQVRNKIATLRRRLERLDRTRRLNRQERESIPYPTVALVGYTNVGKSSLLNRLTGSDALVADKLFATLDSTVRRLELPSGNPVMLIDTVGFIAKLPHELIEAFKGTLEQVKTADLLLHVIDGSNDQMEERASTVEAILDEIGASSIPRLDVYNKSDLVAATNRPPEAITVSALQDRGQDELVDAIEQQLAISQERVVLRLGSADGRTRAWLYQHARVVSESETEEGYRIEVWLTGRNIGRLRTLMGKAQIEKLRDD